MILSTSDFLSGVTKISQDQNAVANFAAYLTANRENSYIKKMFGVVLGQELIDDLAGTPSVPVTAKWQLIFLYFDFDISGYNESCIGLKEILKYLFYNDFVSEQAIINQSMGNGSVRQEATNREGLVKKSTIINNRAAEQIDLLQYYISQHPTNYSNPSGQQFELESAI